jgi:hypothetical protein
MVAIVIVGGTSTVSLATALVTTPALLLITTRVIAFLARLGALIVSDGRFGREDWSH